jgi:hypothetical protein
MSPSDLSIVAAAIAMSLAAALRVGALLHPSVAAESELIPVAKPMLLDETIPALGKPWARPLFSLASAKLHPDFESAAISATDSGSPLPKLIGIIIKQNDRIAIFGYGGKVQRLQEDGRIGAWTVAHINQR